MNVTAYIYGQSDTGGCIAPVLISVRIHDVKRHPREDSNAASVRRKFDRRGPPLMDFVAPRIGIFRSDIVVRVFFFTF